MIASVHCWLSTTQKKSGELLTEALPISPCKSFTVADNGGEKTIHTKSFTDLQQSKHCITSYNKNVDEKLKLLFTLIKTSFDSKTL